MNLHCYLFSFVGLINCAIAIATSFSKIQLSQYLEKVYHQQLR